MPTAMSAKEIAQTAYNAGWRGEELVIATAVALAESSGQYWVVNSIGCVGLWQVYVKVHIGAHPSWTTENMKDPNKNAAAAMVLYKDSAARRGWDKRWYPWEVYTGPDASGSDGPYNAQMGRARMAAAQVDRSGKGVTVPSATGGGGGAGGTINSQAQQIIAGGTADQAGLELITPFLLPLMRWFANGGGEALGEGLTGGGGTSIFGPFTALAKAALAVSVLTIRGAAWMSNPRNWLRIVEVIGGAAALFIGLKMLAGSGVGGPVGGAVTGTVNGATKAVKAVKGTVKKAATAAASVTPPGRAVAAVTAAKG